MTALNRALTALFDVLMSPLGRLPPAAGLAVLSLLTAVAVLLAFKWTADQRSLVATKRTIQAAVFEMRLFNDNLPALLRAQGEVLRCTLRYLRLSLVPTVWLVVPVLALMVHMEFHFGYAGLTPGEASLVKLRPSTPAGAFRAGVSDGTQTPDVALARLEAPEAVEVETPAVFLPSAEEIAWRIRPRRTGSYELRVHYGREVIAKTLLVSDEVARRSPLRPASGLVSELLYPSEPPLPGDSGMAAVAVDYPERAILVVGWGVHWSYVYLALTLFFALALKSLFGVTM